MRVLFWVKMTFRCTVTIEETPFFTACSAVTYCCVVAPCLQQSEDVSRDKDVHRCLSWVWSHYSVLPYRTGSALALLYGTSATLEHHHFSHAVMILQSEVRSVLLTH